MSTTARPTSRMLYKGHARKQEPLASPGRGCSERPSTFSLVLSSATYGRGIVTPSWQQHPSLRTLRQTFYSTAGVGQAACTAFQQIRLPMLRAFPRAQQPPQPPK
eukprot:7221959-Heterocapsa_arctica.AAC.1